jgi:mitochondrial import receptor subunit TOM20
VAYVDVTQHVDETPIEARRRRRMELVRGWRFACGCTRCVSDEAAATDETDSNVLSQKDESKVDTAVTHIENTQAA